MNVDGSAQHPLIASFGENFGPVLSPDGSRIAFVSTRDGQSEIYAANADGSNQLRLTDASFPDLAPVWSPDSTRIAFTRTIGNFVSEFNTDVYVVPAGGGEATRLTTDFAVDQHPSWSPDGSRIVFESLGENGSRLMSVAPDGSNLREVIDASDQPTDPTWSPDGTKLAFSKLVNHRPVENEELDDNRDIYVVNADGTGEARLTTGESVDFKPAWSPDGGLIAYVSIPSREVTPSPTPRGTYQTGETRAPTPVPGPAVELPTEIYVMNADGTAATRVTPDDWADTDPVWRRVSP
jgi:TolB protein